MAWMQRHVRTTGWERGGSSAAAASTQPPSPHQAWTSTIDEVWGGILPPSLQVIRALGCGAFVLPRQEIHDGLELAAAR